MNDRIANFGVPYCRTCKSFFSYTVDASWHWIIICDYRIGVDHAEKEVNFLMLNRPKIVSTLKRNFEER